jgi:hypothetical protein
VPSQGDIFAQSDLPRVISLESFRLAFQPCPAKPADGAQSDRPNGLASSPPTRWPPPLVILRRRFGI